MLPHGPQASLTHPRGFSLGGHCNMISRPEHQLQTQPHTQEHLWDVKDMTTQLSFIPI